MSAVHGWKGKLLRVNLTNMTITKEDIPKKILEDYIGGRGLGVKYLYDEIDPSVDALSPGNNLILASCPLTGTAAPAANRYFAVTKSPLTGAIANSSSGGHFSAELKYSGYDMLIFEGKAKKPVYLWINNDKAELRSAEHIWGKNTHETEDIIVSETDRNAKVASIGPAGENLVLFACIINDKGRAAGRSGVGAVMGSKNLKAVAVRGNQGVTVSDYEGFKTAIKDCYKGLLDPYMTDTCGHYGTAATIEFSNEVGLLPTRNCREGMFESADKIGGEMLAKKYNMRGARRTKGCFACPVGCGRVTKVTDPGFAGVGEGPEYETSGSLGAWCGIDNLAAVVKANFLCNELGMDTISAGSTMSCLMEMYEKGYVSKEEIGFEFPFGSAKEMVELLEKTAYREGFGDKTALGSYRLADMYGHPELSMSTKKLEFPNYDPRGAEAVALAYATNSRGGCHIRAEVHCVEFFGISVLGIVKTGECLDRFTTVGKAKVTMDFQDYYCWIDSCGMCNFMLISLPDYNIFVRVVETATGLKFKDFDKFMKTGRRIFNLERLFNYAAGLSKRDDTLPPRMLEEPLPEGASSGHVCHLDVMLPEYYELRGWNPEGEPTAQTLEELGIIKKW